MNILEGLNSNQFNAVISRAQSLLVLAGAGSGKTKTLTTRIAYLVKERGVSPYNILALTFTRKAAAEMKERLISLVGEKDVQKMWIGTFHGVSLRILEAYGNHLGYEHDITVYDEIDQRDIFTSIINELGMGDKLDDIIGGVRKYSSDCDGYTFDEDISALFMEYRNRLKEFNAVDFSSLLTEVLTLFRKYPDVYNHFHDKFKYVFVDEYQDVDRTQYYLHEAIRPDNIFAVGDYNQNIYQWRGSDMQIILDFEKAHENSEVIILDQSYRCGSKILKAANSLISNNPKQYDIELWTDRTEGEIFQNQSVDAKTEADEICKDIHNILLGSKISFKDIAILTRTHAQQENIVEALRKKKIPFRQIGTETSYWKKSHARMIIAILKILHNQKNVWHFNHICRKVIYPMTEVEWLQYEKRAIKEESSTLQLLVREKQGNFALLLDWYKNSEQFLLSETVQKILELIPLQNYFLDQSLITKSIELLEVYGHIDDWKKLSEENRSVQSFLEWIALQDVQSEIIEEGNKVKVATIHAVKGLEFKAVFVAGMVEGKLPGNKSIASGEIEQERRLCYVAVTRAKDMLILSRYDRESEYGRTQRKPSRFLKEMGL